MKNALAIASLALAVLAGGVPRVSHAFDVDLPEKASDKAIDSAAKLARSKSPSGDLGPQACQDAMEELNIQSKDPLGDIRRCFAKQQAMAAEKSPEQKAITVASRQPQTMQEAVTFYGAGHGNALAASPMLKPDGKDYELAGFIEPNSSNSTDVLVVKIDGAGIAPSRWFAVRVPSSLSGRLDHAQGGSFVRLVGSYRANVPITTTAGAALTMPVFDAKYLEVQ